MTGGQDSTDEPLFEVGRLVPSRHTDPQTSHAAEVHVAVTANNQRGKLLRAYALAAEGLTDDEAQVLAGVSSTSCYWKRCSELRDAGLVVDTGRTRRGRAGVHRIVCAISGGGLRALARMGAATL